MVKAHGFEQIDIDRMSSLGISLPKIQINNDDAHEVEEPKEGFCSKTINIISMYEHYVGSLPNKNKESKRP